MPHLPKLDQGAPLLDYTVQGGGPVATAMVASARLGVPSGFIGQVGDDDIGAFIRKSFADDGVQGWITTAEETLSPRAIGLVHQPTGARSLMYSPGTVPERLFDDEIREIISSASILHLDKPTPLSLGAARFAKQNGIAVSVDLNRTREGMDELLSYTDVLIAARMFADDLAGEGNESEALKLACAMGPSVVIVTLGERGSIGVVDGEYFESAAQTDIDVVDTTGCGDTYHGAFLAAAVRGWDVPSCMSYAGAAAALKTRRLGGREGIPDHLKTIGLLTTSGVEMAIADSPWLVAESKSMERL